MATDYGGPEWIARAGFRVNLHKCMLLVEWFVLLGGEVDMEGVPSCHLKEKAVLGWADIMILRTLSELQSLLGRLQWASCFIREYKEVVAPIESLL